MMNYIGPSIMQKCRNVGWFTKLWFRLESSEFFRLASKLVAICIIWSEKLGLGQRSFSIVLRDSHVADIIVILHRR
jgi:hypothetical protein